MTDDERLLHGFLDHDLSPDDRVAFLVRLGRDSDLRERLIALEELARDAGHLPRAAVPEGFVGRVMTAIAHTPAASADAPVPAGLWRRATDALMAPWRVRWNLASAMGVCALLAITAVGAARWSSAPLGSNESSHAGEAADPQVLVRLIVVQPGARIVQVAGDFNGWDPADTPLEPMANGAWTVTIPLEPGRYEYMFVVDGDRWVADPFALERRDDGFGSENAVLDVRPLAVGSS
jgi:hypothetical protein